MTFSTVLEVGIGLGLIYYALGLIINVVVADEFYFNCIVDRY